MTPYDENYPSKSKLADLIKYDVDFYDPNDPNIVRDEEGHIIYEPDGRPKCADGHGFSYEMPSYTAFLSMIDTATFKKKGIETIVVPYSITYGSWFTLLVKGINAGCIMNTATGGERYNNIKSVVIGENIETIAEGAFDNCPDDFAVRTTLSEKPTDWADDFIDGGTVEYNYLPSDHEKEIFDTSEQRDEDGNLIYYDDKGARVDSEGYYLD